MTSYSKHPFTNPYSRIYDPTALAWWEGEDRIQIELADLRNFFDKVRDPQQDFFERIQVGP